LCLSGEYVRFDVVVYDGAFSKMRVLAGSLSPSPLPSSFSLAYICHRHHHVTETCSHPSDGAPHQVTFAHKNSDEVR
jgi:hypothetical protein